MSNKKTILDPVDQLHMEHLRKAIAENNLSSKDTKLEVIKDTFGIETEQKRKKQNKTKLKKYGFYTTDELIEKIHRYSLLKIKGKSAAINELLKTAFKIVEKDEPMPEIMPNMDFMKIIREIKKKDISSDKQEPAIK